MKTNKLLNNANKAHELDYELYGILFASEWDLRIVIEPKYKRAPRTIVSAFKSKMRAKNFDGNNYKYLLVPTEDGFVEGYISLKENPLRVSAGLSAKPIEEFITATQSIPDMTVSVAQLNKEKPLNTTLIIEGANWFEKHRTGKQHRRFSNVKQHNSFIKEITEGFIFDYCKQHDEKGKKNWNYTNYHNYRGILNKKTVDIFPIVNQNGDGIIYFLVDERSETGKLKRRAEACVFVRHFEIVTDAEGVKYHYAYVDNKQLFVYVAFDKETGNIIYTGQSEGIATRIVRHMNSQEKDSNNAFLERKNISDDSTVKGYAFYETYGSLEINEATVNMFRDFKPSWNRYDFRFLPLTHYKATMKKFSNTWKRPTDLQTLPEGYVMRKLIEQNPDKLVYTTPEMRLLNKNVNAIDVPLFYLTDGTNKNESWKSTQTILGRHEDIINTGQLEHLMKQTLGFIRGVNLEQEPNWYDILMQHGLDVKEAVCYSVGLPIDANQSEDDLTNLSQNAIDSRDYKHTVANMILDVLNYKDSADNE